MNRRVRLKHKKNFFTRIVFVLFIALYYWVAMQILDRNFGIYSYFLIFAMIISYYFIGFLDFDNEVYTLKDTILSALINIIIGFTNWTFVESKKEFILFLLLFAVSNILRIVFCKIKNKKIKYGILGNYENNEKIIKNISNTLNYEYMGSINPDNSAELSEKIKICDEIFIVNEDDIDKYSKSLFEHKMKGIAITPYWYFTEEMEGKIDIDYLHENWIIRSFGFDIVADSFQRRIKRIFDIGAAIIISIISLPIIIISAIIIKIESKGPIFFKQLRIGYGGDEFLMYKFRSMKLHNVEDHSKYAGKDDVRITKFGKFMRKSRIDELPQLLNVLTGDISFVGPRAEWNILGREYEKNIPFYHMRYAVKPGLTGWAQVMLPYGESQDDAERKLEYDIYYIKHQDIALDFVIFIKTLKTVLFVQGR